MPFQQPQPLGANGTVVQSNTERIRATEANRFFLTGQSSASTYNYVGPVNTYVQPWPPLSVQTGPTGLYVVIGALTPTPGPSVTWNSFVLELIIDAGTPQPLCTFEGAINSLFGVVPATLSQGIHTFQLSFAAAGTTYTGGTTVLSNPALVVRPL